MYVKKDENLIKESYYLIYFPLNVSISKIFVWRFDEISFLDSIIGQ